MLLHIVSCVGSAALAALPFAKHHAIAGKSAEEAKKIIQRFSYVELGFFFFASVPSTIFLWLSDSSLRIKIIMTGLYAITVIQKVAGAVMCNEPHVPAIIAFIDGVLGSLTAGVLVAQVCTTPPKTAASFCSIFGGFSWNINRILSFGLLISNEDHPNIVLAVRVAKCACVSGFSLMQFVLIFRDK